MRITDAHVTQLEEQGYVVVEGFLTPEEVEAGRSVIHEHVAPTWEQLSADPKAYPEIEAMGSQMVKEFPDFPAELQANAEHPEILAFLERLLGTDDIRMNQSLIWSKYANPGSKDQHLHWDINDNMVTYPRDDDPRYRIVPMILYYSDVTEEMGPTYVVPQHHTRDEIFWPFERPKDEHPGYYEHERPVTVHAGSLLIYSMSTMHRGSAFRASEGARFTNHIVYRPTTADFAGWRAWGRYAEAPEFERFIEMASPQQRTVLGFPKPGDPYWTEETLRGVAARYPGADMTPYREAAAAPVGS